MCRTFIKTFNIYALCCLVGNGMLLACDCSQITHAQVWFMDVMNVCMAHMQSNHCARIRIKLNGLCIFCHTRLFTPLAFGPICFSIVTRVKYVIWRCVFFYTAITLKIDIKLPSFFFTPSSLLFRLLPAQTLSMPFRKMMGIFHFKVRHSFCYSVHEFYNYFIIILHLRSAPDIWSWYRTLEWC